MIAAHSLRTRTLLASALVCLLATMGPPVNASALARAHVRPGTHVSTASACPWVAQSLAHSASPDHLAGEVLSRMSLGEKVGFLILTTHPNVENSNAGVPRLCVPALTMTDGPNGLGDGLLGVTQLPAAIAVAATFDPALAFGVGRVEGLEARAKGFDAVQSPELNLARIPTSGRIFEAFGEDPFLTSVMGVATIRGIQSTGTMADAKHFSAYTQETARARMNQTVSARVLAELYNAPFRAAVTQGHVASLMCSYGSINGVNSCSDPRLYATLRAWGFQGFVRSDLKAVTNPAPAFRAGMALIKPASASNLETLVRRGAIPEAAINAAVRSILREMFTFGLITRPRQPAITALATSASHVALAQRVAEASVVLLKNRGVLPLAARPGTIAVIGTDAAVDPVVAGQGSALVQGPAPITPLTALRNTFAHSRVLYQSGGLATFELDQISDVGVLSGTPLKPLKPLRHPGEPGKQDISVEQSPNVTPAVATATIPGRGDGWESWSLRVRARKTGVYEIALQGVGDTWLYLNARVILADRGLHAPANTSTTVSLTKGRVYTLAARWFQVRNHRKPHLGIVDVTPRINAATAIARRARVAIVFAGDLSSEGFDRTSLNLGGDANALISAVARANPRTIVVLNTGGAVLMPWLSHVAGVLEAWYPGQVDGAAIAQILRGAVDPSGRLPLTFPASNTQVPANTTAQYPGINSTVNLGPLDGLGYRWYQAHDVRPLFAFGFGLDYTSFHLGTPRRLGGAGVRIAVPVTNTGHRAGTEVVQAYVHYPSGLGEPPEQLRAIARVTLRGGQRATVLLALPLHSFTIWRAGRYVTVPGAYRVDIGQSSADLAYHVTVTLS